MLAIGRLNANRMHRRELINAGTLSAIGVSLPQLLRAESRSNNPKGSAKSIILLWLWGGPSHLDTFDPKPAAQLEYRGPFAPIESSVPGVHIGELFPQIAARMNQIAILRSIHATSNDHGIAGTIGLTGSESGALSLGGVRNRGQVHPTHGAVVSRVLGFDPRMPRFATIGGNLHQGHKRIVGEGGGYLGATHDPFRLDYKFDSGVEIPQLELADWQSSERLQSRRRLLCSLDRLVAQAEASGESLRIDEFYERAFSMLTNQQTRRVFDLSHESVAMRTRYGQFRFGQCCLLARRLVEAGTRFVQVNWSSHVEPIEDTGDGGWDMHDRNFQQMQDRHAWMLDQSLTALIDDLHDRGLLEETVVIAVGEFGRTPKINGKAGRDHWHQCYSGVVAGGGIRPGCVIGSSDKNGEFPQASPVTPADLFATALSRLGIGTTQLTSRGLTPKGQIIEGLL